MQNALYLVYFHALRYADYYYQAHDISIISLKKSN